MHTSVLLHEVIEGLSLASGERVLDGTVGDGGHSEMICTKVGSEGMLIGLDLDEQAIKKTKQTLTQCTARVELVCENFRNADKVLRSLGIDEVDAIVLDLGLRSGQLEGSGRGFSIRRDEPLLMTFKRDPASNERTAYEIVNSWSKDDLVEILQEYGEERFAGKIADAIIRKRKKNSISTTTELVAVLDEVLPERYKRGRLHFATKTFQALRIAVNDELGALQEFLEKAPEILAPSGRIAIISFHSLEDRIIKNNFKAKKDIGDYVNISKKPIIPTREEREKNTKSRSAKLRIAQKNANI